MWVLRYRYVNDNGTWIVESCILKRGRSYDVGRSTKSPLHIKNDKSISRQHIQLSVSQDDDLTVINMGKVTRLGDKLLKGGQTVVFPLGKTAELELGIKPIKASITWLDEIWKVPHDLAGESERLIKDIQLEGIQIGSTLSSKTTLQIIKQNQDTYSNCLFSLVKGVPILREGFLADFKHQMLDSGRDFDSKWEHLLVTHLAFPGFKSSKGIFRGINVIVSSERAFTIFKHIIEVAEGSIWLCDDIFNLDKFIQEKVRSEKIVILIHLNDANAPSSKSAIDNSNFEIEKAKSLRSIASILGFRLHDVNDVVNAVLQGDMNNLLQRTISGPITSSSLSEFRRKRQLEEINPDVEVVAKTQERTDEVPTKKRRRINRNQIKPLDSLAFFAGGLNRQNSDILQNTTGNQQNNQATSNEEARGILNGSTANESMDENGSKAGFASSLAGNSPNNSNDTTNISSKIITPAKNMSVDQQKTGEKSPLEQNSILKRPLGLDIQPQESLVPPLKRRNNGDVSGNANQIAVVQLHSENKTPSPSEDLRQSNSNANMGKSPTLNIITRLSSRDLDKSPQHLLVEAIQKTKSQEVNRLKEAFTEIKDEELTQDAIDQLTNLAIVEHRELLRSQSKEKEIAQFTVDPQWAGRKNFKKFVKVWPKRSHVDSREGSVESLRNQTYLITRDYVDFQPYNPHASRVEDESFEQEKYPPTRIHEESSDNEDANKHSFRFQASNMRHNSRSNDQIQEGDRHLTSTSTNAAGLFVIDDEDSQLSERNYLNDGSFMGQNEQAAQMSSQERNFPKSNAAMVHAKWQQSSNAHTGYGENGFDGHRISSDDDEPQFRFNSRR